MNPKHFFIAEDSRTVGASVDRASWHIRSGGCPACASLNCVKAARILIVCWLASASLATGQAPKKANPPDVFLITIDTLRADHVHCYGYENIHTPALDGLAKDGIRFEQAFTPSPITNTSHTSILTGLLPSSHGVTDFAVPLAPSHPTLAELLKKSGYHTAAFIGAVILDSKTLAPGLDRGFDFYDNFPEHAPTKSRWGRVERRGTEVVQHAETWMTAHPAGSHFVWLHLYDPHDPYEPPPPYSETYKDRLYDGEIAYADSALAGFIGYLKKIGRYDNALIVVVGDHGEGLGEHHEDTHGIFLYDSTTHVPLIVKLPAQRDPDQVVKAQVRTIDILPTIVDWLGIPPPERLDGASLKPFSMGRETIPLKEGPDRVRRNRLSPALRMGSVAFRARAKDSSSSKRPGRSCTISTPIPASWRTTTSNTISPSRNSAEYWPRSKPKNLRQVLSAPHPKAPKPRARTTPSKLWVIRASQERFPRMPRPRNCPTPRTRSKNKTCCTLP